MIGLLLFFLVLGHDPFVEGIVPRGTVDDPAEKVVTQVATLVEALGQARVDLVHVGVPGLRDRLVSGQVIVRLHLASLPLIRN